MKKSSRIRSTTILCVRRGGRLAMGGDGQVTMGESVMKQKARKIRRLFNEKVIAGFAGSTADALSLFSRFEQKLEEYHGNLSRAVVELAKDWRTDRALRHLEALLLVADEKNTYLVSGNGDVIEPDDGIVAIGSGGPLRAGRRARARQTHGNARQRNRPGGHAPCRADLHFYERSDRNRGDLSRRRKAVERLKVKSPRQKGFVRL